MASQRVLDIVDVVGEQPEGLVEADVVDGVPVLGGETVLDAEEVRRGEVDRSRRSAVIVPSHTLIDATRSFSATTCVCTARPSGIAPRPIAQALANIERPSGVQPVFWI